MSVRFLLLLLSAAMPVCFGQIGMYGPVTTHLKAGDVAPEVAFTKVLSVPGSAPWSPSNLTGRLTVLVFFLDTSHNLQSVTQWNAVIDQFAGKPVQFIWVTGESESTLLPWLSRHPVKGWVFHDPGGETGKAYGLERPVGVIIGVDGKIVGFDRAMIPTATLLNAALDGRTTTTPPSNATIKAFMERNLELLEAEPPRMPRMADAKPDFPPSYTLHVSPSQSEGRSNSRGPDFWSLKGYDLKDAIQELYGVNRIRIDLPASLDNGKHYDFALSLPVAESQERMSDRFRQGTEDYFHITARREMRSLDVYVVTAKDHKPPILKGQSKHAPGFVSSLSTVEFETAGGVGEYLADQKPVSLAGIRSVQVGGTADQFCQTLEEQLDRPVVNETNLQGEFKIEVESSAGAVNDFRERLRAQAGLVITPAQRNAEVLAVRYR